VRAGSFGLLRLVWRLKPKLIFSGMYHLNFLVLLLRPFFPRETRVLVRQNGTVSAALAGGDLPRSTRLLYRMLYRRADRVICQTQAMADDLARELNLPREKLIVLPNPVNVEEIRASVAAAPNRWTGPGPHLLAIGRLSPEKGFDLLLQALALVRKQFPETDLLITGAGAKEAALKAERHRLGLDSAVSFAGAVAPPWPYFQGVTLFVLSSRHEGLPNALLEAAAAGVPLVATPASEGLVELLRGQPGAWLATEITAEALADALLAALGALKPGERFPHAFVDAFKLDCALAAYEKLMDETLQETPA
jgi:glycosyltransferase involved in cell wall biosynthesis